MEIQNKIIYIFDLQNIIILKNGELHYYDLRSGAISYAFKTLDLLSNESYFEKVVGDGFDKLEKSFSGQERKVWNDGSTTFSSIPKSFYIPITKNLVEYYYLHWSSKGWRRDDIILTNTHLGEKNVQEFYELSVCVEIEGLRIFDVRDFEDNYIEFFIPWNNEVVEKKNDRVVW